jgi:hypothetical protein
MVRIMTSTPSDYADGDLMIEVWGLKEQREDEEAYEIWVSNANYQSDHATSETDLRPDLQPD